MPEMDQFLEAISPDVPAGEDLRLVAGDLTFGTLDELRREADPRFDPGGETKHADWRGVVELCETLLREKTKDIEIAAVYTQALTHLEGLDGLASGLQLMRDLLDKFWEGIHPGFDEGEIVEAIRARPLSWVGTSRDFLMAVKRVPMSSPIGEEPRSWFDYEQAQRVDTASTKSDRTEHNELIEMGFISTEDWHASLGATPPERLATTTAGLGKCRANLEDLSALCDEKFGESPPYFMDLNGLLDEMQEFVMSFAQDGGAGGGEVDSAGGEVVAATPGGAASAPAGPVSSRDDAYRRLREVAEYLRKTEPHSPVPSLIDRAVRWGNMSFENLFDDVVKNPDVRNQTKDLLGLPKSQT